MGQSWYQLQQKTQECTISDHRHLCWKMWRNLELLIHKGMFLSQPRKTPHYLYIEFIVFPFRLKSENFIVFRNTCNLCYSLVIAMSIKTDNHQLNWSKVMWLFAKWCPVLLVFTLYFWFIFLAYSLRDFILIPYQNLLDLIWVVRTIKQEGVCFINAMHFYCSRWQNVFQITSVYTTAKTKNKTKYKTKKGKQTKGNLEVHGQDDLKSPYYKSLLLSTELQCRKGGSAWITSSLWSRCSLNLFPFVKVVFRVHVSVNR